MGNKDISKKYLFNWVNERFPLKTLWDDHLAKYYAPKNFNFWYYFGSLAVFILVLQIITGIWLTMNYNPSSEGAFDSVEYIMRDVPFGWLLRYLHSTGASFFFIVIYLHMFRAMLYGSYKKPRELIWIFGMIIYMLLMMEGFFGYLLPWGQMSFWGAKVITSLFGAIPFIGDWLMEIIRGDFNISGVTLNRFFALHVAAVPLVILLLVSLHILSLHEVGSNNPDGVDIKNNKDENNVPKDGVAFHPYYTIKDMFGLVFFLLIFSVVLFYFPTMGGYFLEAPNFDPADNLVTPEHIAPVWYFTPFYAILRAIPDKLLGVIAMGASILILFFLPWLDRSNVRSIRYRGVYYKIFLTLFVISFIILGYLGMEVPSEGKTLVAQICTFIYFSFFIFMPIYTKLDKNKTIPKRLT